MATTTGPSMVRAFLSVGVISSGWSIFSPPAPKDSANFAKFTGPKSTPEGVTLVTSGPGCSNLATGLATATSEGDPVVAIGGAVPVSQRLKHVHQTMDTVSLFRPVTKFSAEIDSGAAVSEVVANAFRVAESGRPGASFVSVPQDVMTGETESQ